MNIPPARAPPNLYEHPSDASLAAMDINTSVRAYETTPLLAFDHENPPIPPDLVSINDTAVTSSKYNVVSGRYVQVPQHPSNSIYSTSNYNRENKLKASKSSINVVLLTVVFQSVGFTLVLPSMYLYLKSLNGRDSFYGWIVAMYLNYTPLSPNHYLIPSKAKIGSLLGSVLFGWWSDRRTAKEAIILGTIITILGNGFYCCIGFLPESYGEWFMMTARFLVGFGSGCVAVCRAYCSEVTEVKNKTSMMAAVSGCQGIGFVIGPGLGSVLSKLNFSIGKVVVNEYTSPGYLSAILCLGSVLLVAFLMPGMTPRSGGKEKVKDDSNEPRLPIYITLFLFFSAVSVFAIFETDFTLLSKRDFNWGAETNSIYLLISAIVSTIVYVLIGTPFAKRLDERKATAGGHILLIMGMLAFIVYDKPFHLEDDLKLVQLIIGGAVFSIGYPISSTYVFGLYSKILNPSFQGSKMGWITASGSLARMLGPIWASSALAVSDTLVFGGTAIFLTCSLVVLFFGYSLLIPHKDYGKDIAKPVDGIEK